MLLVGVSLMYILTGLTGFILYFLKRTSANSPFNVGEKGGNHRISSQLWRMLVQGSLKLPVACSSAPADCDESPEVVNGGLRTPRAPLTSASENVFETSLAQERNPRRHLLPSTVGRGVEYSVFGYGYVID